MYLSISDIYFVKKVPLLSQSKTSGMVEWLLFTAEETPSEDVPLVGERAEGNNGGGAAVGDEQDPNNTPWEYNLREQHGHGHEQHPLGV